MWLTSPERVNYSLCNIVIHLDWIVPVDMIEHLVYKLRRDFSAKNPDGKLRRAFFYKATVFLNFGLSFAKPSDYYSK